ncbi:hypothetical protein OX283_003470 [Flavobacterium sp. SUN052]|uniref:hypothetical protein n=1 Tax=Flavobacterium sp. SUN052 TaxID=3002441 RepID=UPI00237DA82A|nr:hypothetical protein [Flavobacterium sp. SUN052]MEC4003702.1 hypothetical protein [Flavobacterium sp. SUN052]
MYQKPPILLDLLHICEFIAMIVGIIKLKSLKNSYWKWLVFYLIYIFMYEIMTAFFSNDFSKYIEKITSLIQIPLEYTFIYWLFAYKSLNMKKIFWIFTVSYFITFFLEYHLDNLDRFSFFSLSKVFGALLILILVIIEFTKQIKSDTILNFKSDKMFYINIGVVLFYIGTMPFWALYFKILEFPEIWNSYYIYFMVSNCIMYLLFAASFVWGKVKS